MRSFGNVRQSATDLDIRFQMFGGQQRLNVALISLFPMGQPGRATLSCLIYLEDRRRLIPALAGVLLARVHFLGTLLARAFV